MKIGEITDDSVISVNIVRGDMSANLSTTVAYVTDGALYVNPFMHNGAILNFAVPDLRIALFAVKPGEVPNYWPSVSVTREMLDGNTFHCIRTDAPGVRHNRRNAFRVFVGEEANVTPEKGVEIEKVTVRDISATGVGFMTLPADKPKFALGDTIRLRYMDNEQRFSVDVTARVVRTELTDKGCVHGCAFTKLYPSVDRYVANKQLKNRGRRTAPKF